MVLQSQFRAASLKRTKPQARKMRIAPRLVFCGLLLLAAETTFAQKATAPEPGTRGNNPLASKGVTHVAVAWSNGDRPLLDRIGARAPLHALWLGMGHPIHVKEEHFFKYVRVTGVRLPPETDRARLALDRLDGPFLLGCDDTANEDCGLEAYDDIVLKENEDVWSLAADSDFYYILARIESVGDEHLELSLAAEKFLGADPSAQPLPYGPVTRLSLKRVGQGEFTDLRQTAPDQVTLYRMADVEFRQRGE